MTRRALIGYTGFVGSSLLRTTHFDELYNSANIDEIASKAFDEVLCAAAPAAMWQANQDPEGDRANIRHLFAALDQVEAKRVVLISTIAVFDDASAGYTESRAVYEASKAYGRNRRELEELVAGRFAHAQVVRLPALFGPGLKKNFVFDLINPVPSFLRPAARDAARAAFTPAEAVLLDRYYRFDATLSMWALDRAALNGSPDRQALTAAVERHGLSARNFTNSQSTFQYYNMARLAADLARIADTGLEAVNICSAPLTAAEVCLELTGQPFDNAAPALVREDMRSDHAALLGGADGYLYGRDSVLSDLKAFYRAETGA